MFFSSQQPNRFKWLWLLILEILAGGLFLGITLAVVAFWWLQQPQNKDTLNGVLHDYISEKLPENWTLEFASTRLDFTFYPLRLDLNIEAAALKNENARLLAPSLQASFDFDRLLSQNFSPNRLIINGATFEIAQTSEALEKSSSQQFNLQQLSLVTLLWLEENPATETVSGESAFEKNLREGISFVQSLESVRINDVRIIQNQGNRQGSIVGNILLKNLPNKEIHLDLELNDPRISKGAIPINVMLSQEERELKIAATFELHAELWDLFPTPIRDLPRWMASLGKGGELTSEVKIPIQHIAKLLPEWQNTPLTLQTLPPLYGKVQLNWPKQSPKLHIQLEKLSADDDRISLSAKSYTPLPPPEIFGITLPIPTSIEAKANSTISFEKFDDVHLVMQGENTEFFMLNGEITPKPWKADISLRGNNLAIDWIPKEYFPKQISDPKGILHTVNGKIIGNKDKISVSNLLAEIRNFQSTFLGDRLQVPQFTLKLDKQKIHLNSKTNFNFQGLNILQASINGTRENGFKGFAEASVSDESLKSFFSNQNSMSEHWKITRPAKIGATFRLKKKNFSFVLDSLHNIEPLEATLWNKPLHIRTLNYRTNPLKITSVAEFDGNPLTFHGNKTQKSNSFGFTLDNLPAKSVKSILEAQFPDIQPDFQDIQANGNIDVKMSMLMSENNDTPTMLDVDLGLSKLKLHHSTMGNIKTDTNSTLSAKMKFSSNWNVESNISLPLFSGLTQARINPKTKQLLWLQSEGWRYNDYPFSVNALRSENGMTIKLKTPDGKFAPTIFKTLLDNNPTLLPEALLPISQLEWSATEMYLDKTKFLRPKLMVDLLKPTKDQSLQPDKTLLDRFFFRLWPADNETPSSNTRKKPKIRGHLVNFHPLNFLKLESEDFGSLLQTLKFTDALKGGITQIEMDAFETDLSGKMSMRNFSISRANAMVALLEAISLTGLVSLLSSDGVPFATMNADVGKEGNLWHVKKMKAFGPGLSLTYSGDLHTESGAVEGKGTISPTSILNNILGTIPLVGTLLTGTDQGGLIAANFTIEGTLDKPILDSQPLSLLQFGIIRNIFDEAGDTGDAGDTGEAIKN